MIISLIPKIRKYLFFLFYISLSIFFTTNFTIASPTMSDIENGDINSKVPFQKSLQKICEYYKVKIIVEGTTPEDTILPKLKNKSMSEDLNDLFSHYGVSNLIVLNNSEDGSIKIFILNSNTNGTAYVELESNTKKGILVDDIAVPLTEKQLYLLTQADNYSKHLENEDDSMQPLTDEQMDQLQSSGDEIASEYSDEDQPLTPEQIELLKNRQMYYEQDEEPLTPEQITRLQESSQSNKRLRLYQDISTQQPLSKEQMLLLEQRRQMQKQNNTN